MGHARSRNRRTESGQMADDPEKLLRNPGAEQLAAKTRRLRAERRLEAAKALLERLAQQIAAAKTAIGR